MPKYIVEFTREELPQVIEDLKKMSLEKTLDEMRDEVAKENKEKIDALTQQVADLDKPKIPEGKRKGHGALNGRWSRNFDACIKCHQGESPHASKGTCLRCYQRQKWQEKHAKVAVPLDVRSEHISTPPPQEQPLHKCKKCKLWVGDNAVESETDSGVIEYWHPKCYEEELEK